MKLGSIFRVSGVFLLVFGALGAMSHAWAQCNTAGMRSAASNDVRELIVVNAVHDRSADLFWIDFDGNWKKYVTIAPNGRHRQQTYRGHVWASVNSYGYCDVVFTVENNVEIIIK